jgi:hypothetical protein
VCIAFGLQAGRPQSRRHDRPGLGEVKTGREPGGRRLAIRRLSAYPEIAPGAGGSSVRGASSANRETGDAQRQSLAIQVGYRAGYRAGVGGGEFAQGAQSVFPPDRRAGRLANPPPRTRGSRLEPEGEDPGGRWRRLGQPRSRLEAQRRGPGRDGPARDPEGTRRRRVVPRQRAQQRLQHLFKQQGIHEHGVRP